MISVKEALAKEKSALLMEFCQIAESYLMMKVMIVKEVMTGDVSPVAMF